MCWPEVPKLSHIFVKKFFENILLMYLFPSARVSLLQYPQVTQFYDFWFQKAQTDHIVCHFILLFLLIFTIFFIGIRFNYISLLLTYTLFVSFNTDAKAVEGYLSNEKFNVSINKRWSFFFLDSMNVKSIDSSNVYSVHLRSSLFFGNIWFSSMSMSMHLKKNKKIFLLLLALVWFVCVSFGDTWW